MNREDLFEAIGTADEAMLERSEKKVNRKRNWLISVTAAAVCMVILVSVFGQYFSPTNMGPAHHIVEENLSWHGELNYDPPDYVGGSSGNGGTPLPFSDPIYQFGRENSIQAQIEEVLPDTYCFPNSPQAFQILRLKVLDTIVGKNIPNVIFYLLPAYLSADILEYDCFIMTIQQRGLENYVMINVTQKRAETFTLLFCSTEGNACYGSMLAFSDNQLDVSLWDKEGWNQAKDEVTKWLTEHDCVEYPGKINRDIKDTKKAILNARKTMECCYYGLTKAVTSDVFAFKEAREALSYIESFGEGAFWHTGCYFENYYIPGEEIYRVYAYYTRVLNGFYTNEQVSISTILGDNHHIYDPGGVTYSKEHFTEADIAKLPDIASFIDRIETVSPPVSGSGDTIVLENVAGYYEKYNGVVFGFVQCSWKYEENGEKQSMNTYYLIYPDNSYQETGIQYGNETRNYMKQWIATHDE